MPCVYYELCPRPSCHTYWQNFWEQKVQEKIKEIGKGILNTITGRINLYRNSAEKKRIYRARKKLEKEKK